MVNKGYTFEGNGNSRGNHMKAPQWGISKDRIPGQKQIIIQNIPDEKKKN